MTTEKINWLMYKTTMNDIERKQDPTPENEFWETPTPSIEGAFRLQMVQKFVFTLPGKYHGLRL